MAWADALRHASFRGVPFAVLVETGQYGRRVAGHVYPFRDTPWNEDIGRAGRRFPVNGFLIEDSLVYGGGAAMDQRDALVAAIEQEGPGTLVLPTIGSVQVQIDDTGTITASPDGRKFEFHLTFLEAGQQIYPSATTDTGAAVSAAADAADAAAAGDFASAIKSTLARGQAVVSAIQAVVSNAMSQVTQQAAAATSLLNEVSNLSGNFGRYFNGANVGGLSLTQNVISGEIVQLIPQAAAARALVATAAATASSAAGAVSLAASGATSIATAVQAATAALSAACVNPADAVQIQVAIADVTSA